MRIRPPVEVDRPVVASDQTMQDIPPLYAGKTDLSPAETERAWSQDRQTAAACIDRHAVLKSVILRRR